MVFQVTEFKNVNNFSFVFCRDVMTSCHDVTKPDLPISECRCARKLILFLFPWFFRSLSSKMLIISYLCFAVTSWRHVMTSLNLIYLSQLVDVLESWFFFCFHVFFRSLSSKIPLTFYFCDSVTSWRHVMTSLNLIHLSQLVEELESSFFFVYMVLWVTEFKKIDDFSFVWFRDVMTSCHDVTKTVQPISGYEFTGKMIVFRIPQFFWLLILEMFSVHVFVGWYHVITSRHDVTPILNITLQYLLIL